ncbi:MAG TPA: glycosyltransferase [Candidatus Pacearchaeota archaeon]|nr:glycosyltransferase [Candidatus Pacearchaeota archaeon]
MRSPFVITKEILANYLNPKSWKILLYHLNKEKSPLPTSDRIKIGLDWILQMQNNDGGIASQYSLLYGRCPNFPETTGYIIPTLIKGYNFLNEPKYLNAAKLAGDWLIKIQNDKGYFTDIYYKDRPMVFDTAQAMSGLLTIYNLNNEPKYLNAAKLAGDWLVSEQDENGSWTKNSYNKIPHTYYSRASLCLLELWLKTKDLKYKETAIKNLNWVVSQQKENGFFNNSSFFSDNSPALHTIAYTLEGLLKSWLILRESKDCQSQIFFDSVKKTADKISLIIKKDGIPWGHYNPEWQKIKKGRCLTGLAQISEIFFLLFKETNNQNYLKDARKIIRYLKSLQITQGPKEILGAISGSDPINGTYMPNSYPNWAEKFFLDALFLEQEHKEKYLSLAVFPNDPIESYLNKGETRENYWNPNDYFKEIFVFNDSNYNFNQKELEKLQFMAGTAKLHIFPIYQAEEIIKNFNVDSIRTYGVYQPGLLSKKLAKKYNIPLILSVHTNYDDYRETVVKKNKQYLKYIKQIVWKYLFEIGIIKSAQKIIAVYDFAALYLKTLNIPQEKISIIYNRVSPKKFFKDTNISKKEIFTIINVNSFIPAKNQEALIRACQYADFNLILIGQGPQRQKLIDLAKDLGVKEKIEFIASVPNNDLPKLYNQCHAYATVIKIGGIGIGVIESMACGLPIITGKLDSETQPELLGFDNCVFVENNPEDIASKIQRLIDDKNYYQEMSQKSLAVYSKINGEKGSQAEKNIYLSNI